MKRDPKTGAPDSCTFARDYLHTYLPTVQRRPPKTTEAYRISLGCFLDYLPDHQHTQRAHVSFDHFDRDHLKGWLAWMSDQRHYPPRTIALRLGTLTAFLTHCPGEDITLVAPSQAATALRAPASAGKPIEYLTEPETRAVPAAFTGGTAKPRRNRMLLTLPYDTAARVSEITSLRLQDLCLDPPGHARPTGTGDKTRVVPLTSKTIEHLRVYPAGFHPDTATLPARRPVSYTVHHGKPTRPSTDTAAAVPTSAATTARRSCPPVPGNIHCHMLRKTKAMDPCQQGTPLPIIMRLLGHENVPTTAAFYASATLDMMREALNAATPAINSPPERLTEDKPQALYSLR